MTNFLQETDSQSWDEGESSSSSGDVTSGIEGQANTFRLRGKSDPVKRAIGILSQIENPGIAEQLVSLLSIIDVIVNRIVEHEGIDLSYIPLLNAHIEEDGSVLLEWVFPDFRIGFNIEPNPNDSGWHLVSGNNLRNRTESGQLVDTPKIGSHLYDFIRSNI